jgi:hypothetical protein
LAYAVYLPAVSSEAALGGLIFNLTEPFPGHEAAFRRWYGTDHYYAGAMAGPGVVAGRCWQSTSAWTPNGPSPSSGAFLGTFFLLAEALPAYQQWSADVHPRLTAAGRMFPHRRVLHRGRFIYRYALTATEPAGPVSALDQDFSALLAVLTAPGEQQGCPAARDAVLGGLDLAFDPVPGGYSEVAAPDHGLVLAFRRVAAVAVSAGQMHTAVQDIAARRGSAATWAGLFRPVAIRQLVSSAS